MVSRSLEQNYTFFSRNATNPLKIDGHLMKCSDVPSPSVPSNPAISGILKIPDMAGLEGTDGEGTWSLPRKKVAEFGGL